MIAEVNVRNVRSLPGNVGNVVRCFFKAWLEQVSVLNQSRGGVREWQSDFKFTASLQPEKVGKGRAPLEGLKSRVARS